MIKKEYIDDVRDADETRIFVDCIASEAELSREGEE
jgi:hypothetical protein